MTKAGRTATAVLVTALAVMAGGRVSAQDESIATDDQTGATIVLHVENHASLPGDLLRGAKARVERVYKVIGVRIVWVDSKAAVGDRRDGRLHLTVVLLSGDMARKKISAEGLKGKVVGQAHLLSGRAYIFCDRIAPKSGRPRFFAIPLGDVIAHEVGHLLLRENSHSQTGIMRRAVDMHSTHVQIFDPTQANTIRKRLTELLVAAGLAGTAGEAFGADADLPAIRILVVNKIGVPPTDVLVRAQSETARIYAAVGVRLEWAGQPALPRLVMMIPADSNLGVGVEDVAADAMGAAPAADDGTGRVAYAFYVRIEALAQRRGIDVAKVLGIVMAHEIGHLLLGFGAHSSAGIMSGRWGKFEMDLVAAGLLGFTKEQADVIRRAVVRLNAQ